MHSLERALDCSSDKKMLWLEHHTLHVKIEGVISFIYRTDSTELSTTVLWIKHTYAEIEWVIPVSDNFRHF